VVKTMSTWVTDAGGVKGLIKISRRIKPASLNPKPRRISLPEPNRPTLVLLRPSGEAQTIPDDIDKGRPSILASSLISAAMNGQTRTTSCAL